MKHFTVHYHMKQFPRKWKPNKLNVKAVKSDVQEFQFSDSLD